MVDIGNKITVQTFEMILRIDLYFEMRKRVHRNWRLLIKIIISYWYMYWCINKGRSVSSFLTWDISSNNHLFTLKWDHRHWEEKIMGNMIILVMNLPFGWICHQESFISPNMASWGVNMHLIQRTTTSVTYMSDVHLPPKKMFQPPTMSGGT